MQRRERHESMVDLRVVRGCARRSARCLCPAAISGHARRPCRTAGARNYHRIFKRRARFVCHLGQIHRPGVEFHHVKPDWKGGTVERLRTVFVHDPDRKIPFLIVNESTKERYLTGADLDIESMQFVGDSVWFGDEFGPYLLQTDWNGKVLALHETKLDGKPLRSPDHYAVNTPAVPGSFSTPVRRSRGFEGMVSSLSAIRSRDCRRTNAAVLHGLTATPGPQSSSASTK